jgi:hypothetical protein
MLMPAPEQKTMHEPTIYFSHETYDKLQPIDATKSVKLLEVFNKTTAYMSDAFKDYDTTYRDKANRKKQFKLHNGMNLILLLQDSNGKLFTTIRSYTVKKYNYYMYMRGKEFKLAISETDFEKTGSDTKFPDPINNIYY